MRVAFVPPPTDSNLRSSIGIWTYEVAKRMAKKCGVLVYSCGGSLARKKTESMEGFAVRRLDITPDRWLLRPMNRLKRLFPERRPLFSSWAYYYFYVEQLARDLKKQGCDIVHVHTFSQFIPVIRRHNPGIKIVLHMHCEWLSQLERSMIERRLGEADIVLGCSDYVTEKVCNAFPQYAGKCMTVHNGVDEKRFVPGGAAKGDVKRLLFACRISPEKGLHVLLDAFREIVKRRPSTELVVAGPEAVASRELIIDVSDDPRVRALASLYDGEPYLAGLRKRLPREVRERIVFTGFVRHAEMVRHYHEADVFINSSFWEAFAMPILEAMACGLPVVATKVGGAAEAIKDGRSGVLVEPGDAGALAGAVLKLLGDEGLMRSMRDEARKRVLERFTWDAVADTLLERYGAMARE